MRANYLVLIGILVSGVTFSGCSDESSDTTVDKVQPAGGATQEQPAQPAEAPAQQVATGFQQMAKGLQQLATSPENATTKPVHFRELKKVFVPFSGWTLSNVSGQMMNMPVPFSQAEGTYSDGKARIKVSITDSAMNQVLLAPFSMMMAAGFERESDTGYERSATVAGTPAWEKWRSDQKSGELTMLVNKRYLVKLEGSQVDSVEPLKKLGAHLDFSKIDTSHTGSDTSNTTK